MYLRGLRGFFEGDSIINKRKMRFLLVGLSGLYAYGWISHNWLQHVRVLLIREFDIRK